LPLARTNPVLAMLGRSSSVGKPLVQDPLVQDPLVQDPLVQDPLVQPSLGQAPRV
jgi:hypothetical protein